jgi:hypothetical protein
MPVRQAGLTPYLVIRLDVEADAPACRAELDRRRHILHGKVDITDLR